MSYILWWFAWWWQNLLWAEHEHKALTVHNVMKCPGYWWSFAQAVEEDRQLLCYCQAEDHKQGYFLIEILCKAQGRNVLSVCAVRWLIISSIKRIKHSLLILVHNVFISLWVSCLEFQTFFVSLASFSSSSHARGDFSRTLSWWLLLAHGGLEDCWGWECDDTHDMWHPSTAPSKIIIDGSAAHTGQRRMVWTLMSLRVAI